MINPAAEVADKAAEADRLVVEAVAKVVAEVAVRAEVGVVWGPAADASVRTVVRPPRTDRASPASMSAALSAGD